MSPVPTHLVLITTESYLVVGRNNISGNSDLKKEAAFHSKEEKEWENILSQQK